MQPASQSRRHWLEAPVFEAPVGLMPRGLERPAPPPTLCAQAYTPLGTPQGLRDLLPLTTPTQRTPEKTQTASMRRTPGLLRSMFDFAQQSAGNLWQLLERAIMHQDSV
jgi:hypothetical protein